MHPTCETYVKHSIVGTGLRPYTGRISACSLAPLLSKGTRLHHWPSAGTLYSQIRGGCNHCLMTSPGQVGARSTTTTTTTFRPHLVPKTTNYQLKIAHIYCWDINWYIFSKSQIEFSLLKFSIHPRQFTFSADMIILKLNIWRYINQLIYSIQCSTSKTIIYKVKYIAYIIYRHILMHGVADVYVYGSPREKITNCY